MKKEIHNCILCKKLTSSITMLGIVFELSKETDQAQKMCVYMCTCTDTYKYVYMYIQRERERI